MLAVQPKPEGMNFRKVRGDEHAVNGRLEVTALPVGDVAW
jgi:hypothetical protein